MKLKKINEAWLNLDQVDDEDLFNPMSLVKMSEDDFHYRLLWLMTRPEYFSFLCKQILNINILPSQALFLCEMWNRKFPMLIASRGFGKSFMLSLYSILRALILPERKVVVVGAAFRQSKVLFEYMETIWNNAPILRSMCDASSGPRRDVDRCVMRINKSRVTCLPLGDGQKIRGQRANDIISDEFACLEKDSIVETNNGFVRINDFDRAGEIFTGDDKHPLEIPEKFIRTPKTDVYEIKMSNGYVIRCSKDHQVMTNKGWKKPKDLDDSLYIEKAPNKVSRFGTNPDGMTPKLAWLMGMLVSEGAVTNKNSTYITTTDDETANKLINEYDFKVHIRDAYKDNRGWSCKKSYQLYLNNTKFREKLFNLGLDYGTAHKKKIPWSILQSDEETVRHFLSGLFDGDGSCFLWSDRNVKRIGLAYYSVSERLCRDVQFLMYKLGFDGYINSRKSKISENDQWFVRWNGSDAKTAAIYLSVDRFSSTIDSCSVPEDPSYISWDKSRKKWKVQYKYLDKTIQKRFKNKSDAEEFLQELQSRKQYRKIVSITKLDKVDHLYDYYLPKTNSFYAEGHRQHNSIPRDIFETVVAGFAAVSSDPIENVKKIAAKKKAEELGLDLFKEDENIIKKNDNQIILSGTAYYDFNHFAEYWKKWRSIIQSQGKKNRLRDIFGEDPPKDFNWKDYSIIRIPYELLPEGFMDASQVARSKATVHAGIYQMEFGACFTRDSQGFFKRTLIESCVTDDKYDINPAAIKDSQGNPICFQAQLRGDLNKKYVFGVDPASEVDNFSIVVIELNGDHRRIVHVWTTNREQHKEKVKSGYSTESDFYAYCARKIRDLMKIFPCIHIAMDAGGGGIAVMESLHDNDKIQEGEHPIWEVIDENKEKDTDYNRGLHILEMCQFSRYDWLSEANHGMRKDFEDKVLLFPMFDTLSLDISLIEDDMKGRSYDTLEQCVMEIEDLKDELAMIQITQTATGRDKWDTPETVIGTGKKGKLRKDRYSSLLMANMAARTIDRTPDAETYNFYGGFATVEKSKDPTGKLYQGPQWFTDGINGIY